MSMKIRKLLDVFLRPADEKSMVVFIIVEAIVATILICFLHFY